MAAYSLYTDQELTTLLKQGDSMAFTEIYNRYFEPLYLHALKKLKEEDEAEGLVHDLFSVLLERAGEIKFNVNLSANINFTILW